MGAICAVVPVRPRQVGAAAPAALPGRRTISIVLNPDTFGEPGFRGRFSIGLSVDTTMTASTPTCFQVGDGFGLVAALQPKLQRDLRRDRAHGRGCLVVFVLTSVDSNYPDG